MIQTGSQLHHRCHYLWVLFLGLCGQCLYGQQIHVSGTIRDSLSGETLPMANLFVAGTDLGIQADENGFFEGDFEGPLLQLTASYVGYISRTISLEGEGPFEFDFVLLPAGNTTLKEVVIQSGRYRNKNNPAVDLVKEVIDHAARNRKESLDYYSYEKYEKMEVALSNVPEQLSRRKIFRQFKFIADHADTSDFTNTKVLPFYFREILSEVYYRKDPKVQREHQLAVKRTELKKYLDNNGLSSALNRLYGDFDIYHPKINVATNYFVSPLAPLAPTFYRYYILDTVDLDGQSCIDLAFFPRNKTDLCFKGHLFIANDSTFAVARVIMEVPEEINLNFVKALYIEQDFGTFQDSIRMVTRERMAIDLGLNPSGKQGFVGDKTSFYSNFTFNTPAETEKYAGSALVVEVQPGQEDEAFWAGRRPEPLSKREAGTYTMIDSIQHVPAFRRGLDLTFLLISGYFTVGGIDVGPVNTWGAFNTVEGFRTRFGGMTNNKFHRKLFLDGYLAYGFRDQRFKYMASAGYSFNKTFLENPRHYVQAAYQRDVIFPGQVVDFFNEDGIVMSFRRGALDRMLMNTTARLSYMREYKNGFSYQAQFERKAQEPIGSLDFKNETPLFTDHIGSITTSEASLKLRFAPHEQYYQGKILRVRISSEYPVFTLRYAMGIPDLFGSEYSYHRLTANISKRFHISPIGYTYLNLEAGKLWGQVPYPLLLLPRANQSYFYQSNSFNMMNFLEFANDAYVGLNAEHYFNGFFFNKIPLFKQLKLREVVSMKVLYGSLSRRNNPNLNEHDGQIEFPEDQNGDPIMFTLQRTPYMELGFGISNIARVLRFDLVRRMTYIGNPNVPSLWGVRGLGLRGTLQFEF